MPTEQVGIVRREGEALGELLDGARRRCPVDEPVVAPSARYPSGRRGSRATARSAADRARSASAGVGAPLLYSTESAPRRARPRLQRSASRAQPPARSSRGPRRRVDGIVAASARERLALEVGVVRRQVLRSAVLQRARCCGLSRSPRRAPAPPGRRCRPAPGTRRSATRRTAAATSGRAVGDVDQLGAHLHPARAARVLAQRTFPTNR